MLSFQVLDPDGIVNISFDREGRDYLIRILEGLKCPGNHDHLMSEEWGGNELDIIEVGPQCKTVHMVNIGIPYNG